MSKPWKPLDYRSVSPCLLVGRGEEVRDFLRAAFGAVSGPSGHTWWIATLVEVEASEAGRFL